MTNSKAARRPPIHMIDTEVETLTNLALGAQGRLPEVSELLLDEIGRARIHSEEKFPANTVSMGSVVEFADEQGGSQRTVQLVYPGEADIAAGKISILTHVGAGLIGLKEGQSIIWPDRNGKDRVFKIGKVVRPETAAHA